MGCAYLFVWVSHPRSPLSHLACAARPGTARKGASGRLPLFALFLSPFPPIQIFPPPDFALFTSSTKTSPPIQNSRKNKNTLPHATGEPSMFFSPFSPNALLCITSVLLTSASCLLLLLLCNFRLLTMAVCYYHYCYYCYYCYYCCYIQ